MCTHHAADEQQQRENHVDRLIDRGLQERRIGSDKDDLEEGCANDHLGRHTEKVNHGGDHNETAADAHDGGEDTHQKTYSQRQKRRAKTEAGP